MKRPRENCVGRGSSGFARTLLCCLVLSFSQGAAAEQFVQNGEYIVHYAAMNSTDIAPDVALRFGVERSRRRGLLVLNPQRAGADGQVVPLPASARGVARSLIGHVQSLELRPAQEGEVHYLLAEFQTLNLEYLTFELQVTPQGSAAPLTIRFQQQFFE